MPRSYSFDHFQVPKTMRPMPRRGKKKTSARDAKPAPEVEKTDIHYGKKFAQTEELYQAHVMEAQLEELAGLTRDEPRMSRSAEPEADPIDQMRKSAPIGGMPTAELPGRKHLKDFLGDGMRHVQLLRHGMMDVLNAATFFVGMPRDMIKSLFHVKLPFIHRKHQEA